VSPIFETQESADAVLDGERHAPVLPLNAHSLAYSNYIAVKSGRGILFGFTVYNSKASSQFIQVFDLFQLPADGSFPAVVFEVDATSNRGVYWGELGRSFNTGLLICNSSTGPTKTIGSADCWFDVQYL
jgi:hypothetical protein